MGGVVRHCVQKNFCRSECTFAGKVQREKNLAPSQENPARVVPGVEDWEVRENFTKGPKPPRGKFGGSEETSQIQAWLQNS